MIFRIGNMDIVRSALALAVMCSVSICATECIGANNNQLQPTFMVERGVDGSVLHITYYAKVPNGRMQFSGEQTFYDWEKSGFIAKGGAKLVIGGQNSKLEADAIFYDRKSGIVAAEGNATLTRYGQSRTGPAYRFKVTSPQYLVTKPNTSVIDPLGFPVRDAIPGNRQFDERLREVSQSDGKNVMRFGPIPYSGGYGNSSGYRGGSQTGDFGSEIYKFTPG